MHSFFKRSALLISFGIFLACSTSRNETPNQDLENSETTELSIQSQRIPPNRCRIIGTIVEIDTTLTSKDPENPCSKAPCRALVRVEEIIGYGQGFSDPLAKEEEIRITFRFTLSPTTDLFPKMQHTYPGLPIGATFSAEVEEQSASIMSEKDPRSYVIYGYEIK